MSDPILSYPCPHCGKTVKVKAPAKSGAYKIACPHCNCKVNIKLPGRDELAARIAAGRQAKTPDVAPAPFPAPAAASPVRNNPAVPPEFATAGRPAAEQASAQQPTKTAVVDLVKKGAGKLERLGKMFNDSFPLKTGLTTIGRYDSECMSDISIKGDSYMSRRSASIEVKYDNIQGFTYRLRVLAATNPVLLNGQNMNVGADAFLNFGDIIVLGNTRFRLDSVK